MGSRFWQGGWRWQVCFCAFAVHLALSFEALNRSVFTAILFAEGWKVNALMLRIKIQYVPWPVFFAPVTVENMFPIIIQILLKLNVLSIRISNEYNIVIRLFKIVLGNHMSAELQKFVFLVPLVLTYIYTNLSLLIKKKKFRIYSHEKELSNIWDS